MNAPANITASDHVARGVGFMPRYRTFYLHRDGRRIEAEAVFYGDRYRTHAEALASTRRYHPKGGKQFELIEIERIVTCWPVEPVARLAA